MSVKSELQHIRAETYYAANETRQELIERLMKIRYFAARALKSKPNRSAALRCC